MQKIMVLRGLPGSGKTTIAKMLCNMNDDLKRLNRDDFRWMLDGYSHDQVLEDVVSDMFYSGIHSLIAHGFSVIIDNMNLRNKDIKKYRELAEFYELPLEITVIDTPLEECIRRDSLREKPVGEEKIREMAKAFYSSIRKNNSGI